MESLQTTVIFRELIKSLPLRDISKLCKLDKSFYTLCKQNKNYIKKLIKDRKLYISVYSEEYEPNSVIDSYYDLDDDLEDFDHYIIIDKEKPDDWYIYKDLIDHRRVEILDPHAKHVYVLFHFAQFNVDDLYVYTDKNKARREFEKRSENYSKKRSYTDNHDVEYELAINKSDMRRWVLVKYRLN